MQKETFKTIFIILISGVSLLVTTPAHGQANVYWDSLNYPDDFSPSTVAIAPGGNVTFWDVDTDMQNLSLTFANGSNFIIPYNSGLQLTFPATGVYSYKDQYDSSGTVTVIPPPTVTITSPTNNAVFPAPATFTVQATASASAGDSVNDVQFFLDDGSGPNSIADVFTPPYTNSVTNLAAGVYTLSAVATDAYGLTSTNAITATVTGSATISLGSPRFVAGQFLFDVTGLTAGETNIVQASTDLISWTPTATNIASTTSITVTNTAAAALQYFRILQLP